MFNPGGVLHLNHDLCQDVFPDAGRGKEIGGAYIPHAGLDSRGSFRAIGSKPGYKGLSVGEDIVTNPGHGEIGHDLFIFSKSFSFDTVLGRDHNVAMGKHYTLGVTGCT